MNVRRFRFFGGSHLQLKIGAAFALLALALFMSVGWLSGQQARRQVAAEIGAALAQVAGQLSATLETDMAERYREIRNLADFDGLLGGESGGDPARWRAVLERIQRTYEHYAWIGLTDTAGTVLAATGGVLEGRNVSQRPWFQQAQTRPFAGDVHDAVMLAKLLPPTPEGEPLRLVDVAAPVLREGRPAGVLGAHLSWRWAEERRRHVLQPLQARQIEAVLVNGKGELLLGPGPGGAPVLPAATIERLRNAGPGIESWSDGGAYLTAVVRGAGDRDYPGLGWHVLVRQPADLALAPAQRLEHQLWAFGLIGALAFGLLGWWLAGRLSAPLRSLAQDASALAADGWDVPLPRAHDEVHVLAKTLGELMRRLQRRGEELVQLNATLEQQVQQRTERLERVNDDLKSFSRSVSHDLKGPLGSIAQLLKHVAERERGRIDPASERSMALVRAECDRLRRLIDELMMLAQVEQRPLQWGTVSMAELARFVVERVRDQAPALDTGDAEPQLVFGELPVIDGDPVLLHQVWQNLVSNALKFSRRASPPRIEITAETTKDEIVYSVSDNGSGFEMGQIGRLFGVFQRLHRDADVPGTGIGLSIVKRIVHRHGGRVWAHSVPGERTSFFFALPRHRAEASTRTAGG